MDLIKLYIQEVTRRLPEKTREDIALELKSTILDMLSDDYTDEDVYQVLEELGDPVILAAGYRDRPMHLIGPKFYDQYIDILKLVTPIVGIIVFITFLIETIHTSNANQHIALFIITLFGESIWVLMEAGIQVFFWITIVFIILERSGESVTNITKNQRGKRWKATDLKKTSIPVKKAIKLYEPCFNLFWIALWITLYFNADQIIGVYNGTKGLTFVMPIFNQATLLSYSIIILAFIGMEVIKFVYMLIVREWTMKLAIWNMINHLVSFIILFVIIRNPALFHSELAPYLANVTELPLESILQGITWITWTIFTIVLVTGTIASLTGFKKAKRTNNYF